MPRHLLPAALLLGIFATSSAAQTQGFDILIPSGSNDGAFALVDTSKDGTYSAAGECWDYIKAPYNTSPRNYVLMGGKIFFSEQILSQIVWVQDTNGDGQIDAATERHVYYDVAAGVGGTSPVFVTEGANGWLWWVNDAGNGEGIYRSKDLNNDGDAEDAGETVPVLVETMAKVSIANTPVSTVANNNVMPVVTVDNLNSIYFDAKYGQYGRFICEEENVDQTICFEDKNNDGDFADPGECYLFCALYDGSRTPPTYVDNDANPDVKAAKLPVANEIFHVVVNNLTTPPTYSLLSLDTTATQADAGIIFRGQDLNKDGDINDAGEVTVYWDGSLDSTGAGKGYNFCYGMAIDVAGRLFVTAEWDATPDAERLIMLVDGNTDLDANDPGETTVLWELPADRTQYVPALFPPGTLKVQPKTNLGEIAYYGSATCQTSLNTTTNPSPSYHNIQYGLSDAANGRADSSAPIVGNTRFRLRTWDAAPNATGAYGIGLTQLPNGVPVGLGGTCHIYHDFVLIPIYFKTDAEGIHDQLLPLPNNSTYIGLRLFWQSVVVDATAPSAFGLTFSDAIEMKIGDYSYTL